MYNSNNFLSFSLFVQFSLFLSMAALHPREGYFVNCDSTTKVFLEKKNEELSQGDRFIIASLKGDCLFIKSNKVEYVRALVDEWIDKNNTPKKTEEKNQTKKKQ